MNYRHIYHAGNFADVFKHVLLIGLIESLQRKETPFCYFETHAGIGSYDLFSTSTQKSQEYLGGVAKIISEKVTPPWVATYLTCIKTLNATIDKLRYYPGSPYFVKQLLRETDRAVLSELHPDDVLTLKKTFFDDKKIHIHHQDGYQSLKALLPPKERRGLILIDPAYEKSDELNQLPHRLAEAIQRFATGIYAIWYPIKKSSQLIPFYRDLKNQIAQPMLVAEFCVYADDIDTGLNGCGMVIVNPPWQFDEELRQVLPWLLNHLKRDARARYTLKQL